MEENKTTQNAFSEDDSTSKVDWRAWTLRFVKSWYWFVLSLAVFMSIAYLKNRSWKPRYVSNALVIIEEGKGMLGSTSSLMQGFSVEKAYRNVNNQVIMFGSNDLIRRVIDQQPDLTVDYYTHGRFRSTNLYKQSPIRIEHEYIAPQSYNREFRLEDLGGDKFRISAEATKKLPEMSLEGVYDEEISTSHFFLKISKTSFYREGMALYFKLYDPEQLTAAYSSKLSFDFLMKGSSVVKVGITGEVPQRDCDFLNGLCDEFLADNLNRKNDAAIKTVDFIDAQMEVLTDSLRISENKLKNYKANNFVVASSGGSTLMSEYIQLDALRSELRLQESYLTYLSNYLKTGTDEESIVAPVNMGINDPNLSALVGKLTDLQFKRKEVGEKSPLYAKYSREMDNIKIQLDEVLSNLKASLTIRKQDLDERTARMNEEMQTIPYKEQQFANIQREFKLNDNFYTFLMQKRADAQIQKASNSPDNIILDRARMSGITNSGEKKRTYTTFLLLALALPAAFIFLKEILVTVIRTEQEVISLSENAYTIGGVVRHTHHRSPIMVINHPKSAVTEAFRILRTRIEFKTGKSERLCTMITSTQSGDGKTYIAANMAAVFALTGRKTLLIDMDLRKPSVQMTLSLRVEQGLSAYLSDEVDDWHKVVVTETKYGFDVLPVGVIPPNPGELIKSARMKELMEALKKEYDYIVIDTSPIGLVADAYALTDSVDIILYSIRCERTNKSFFKASVGQMRSNGIRNMLLVFNDVNFKKMEYSHYYDGYGSYGAYGAYYGNTKANRKLRDDYFEGNDI
ncbi:MAG: polysaccharide biosynthesis tyrosine autokinase [Paludibacteraceae bacterium]|nr:polysaccharide biosynthesis tyrosine autokinase [Paludibacteraceae bacterium]